MYYTYILRCEDNSLYAGIASDVKRRMDEHFSKSPKCAKYTRTHTPIKLEAVWQSADRASASRLEFQLKRLKKVQKENLLADNDFSVFKDKLNADDYTRTDISIIE